MSTVHKAKVRIEDIARRAGVTKASVSLALRDREGVSDATRKRLKELAAEMGYVPDPAMSAFASYRMLRRPISNFNVIPFLTNYESKEDWMNSVPYHRALFLGARDRGKDLGYEVENFWMKEARSERVSHILKSRGIRGLLLAPTPFSLGHLRLDWDSFASVSLSYSVARPLCHYAVSNQYQGMSLVWHHIWHYGYRRVGLVISEVFDRRSRHRWLASNTIEQALRLPLESRIPPLLFSGERPEGKSFAKWFREWNPEVLICIDPSLIAGFLAELGKSVPGDVGIASLEVSEEASPWSGINQHPYDVGVAAMEMLHSLILIGSCGIPVYRRGLLVEATWHEGSTLMKRAVGGPPLSSRKRAVAKDKVKAVGC